MKNAVFWDIKTEFVPHRRHITSPLQSPDGQCCVRLEVFTTVILRNANFWDVIPCGFLVADVSEEGIVSFIGVKRIIKLETLAVSGN
jgi:hypothetical protein